MLSDKAPFYLTLRYITSDDEYSEQQEKIDEEGTDEIPHTETQYHIIHRATDECIGTLTETYGQFEVEFDDEKARYDFEKEKDPEIDSKYVPFVKMHDMDDLYSATNLIMEKVGFLDRGISDWKHVPEDRRPERWKGTE